MNLHRRTRARLVAIAFVGLTSSLAPRADASTSGHMPTVTIADASTVEGDSGTTPMTFEITLSHRWHEPVSVDWYTGENNNQPGWATAYDDVVPTGGRVTIDPGETRATVSVDVVGDTLDEPDELFFLDAFDPNGAWGAQAAGTIVDDDEPVIPVVSIDDASAAEGNTSGNTVRFVVSLSEPTTRDVELAWTTAPSTSGFQAADAGVDYDDVSGTVLIPAGSTNVDIRCQTIGDLVPELDETFRVVLMSADGAAIGDDGATGTILNDDPVQVLLPI
jgi:hypothetical protein